MTLTLDELEKSRSELKTPLKPAKLGNNEDDYREYRDTYNEFSVLLSISREKLNKLEAIDSIGSPYKVVKKKFDHHQATLNAQVNKLEKSILSKLDGLSATWSKLASEDRGTFYKNAIHILDGINDESNVESALNALDKVYIDLSDDYAIKYSGILRALEHLGEGVNFDYAFSMAEEEKLYFEEKANQLQALAQLGISVEVLAHELEQQDALVTKGLNSLPHEIKSHPGFTLAMNAHKSLTSQIRFLSPLKLSGYQMRQEITGKDIQTHIHKFFRERFDRQRVNLIFGEGFLSISIKDLPSRIYPVFVNIINNALYWVCLNKEVERKIIIDLVEGEVVIANTGPPIDEDDADRLFDIFYSRRASGHGVGLYLCRQNLAVAHHKIRYSFENDIKLIEEGANFVLTFNGMKVINNE